MLVKELLNSNLTSGEHKINWDGTSNSGTYVMNGLYFYQVKINNEIYSNKMFLIK
jgi:flagellar hook assembly protein FlgD